MVVLGAEREGLTVEVEGFGLHGAGYADLYEDVFLSVGLSLVINTSNMKSLALT